MFCNILSEPVISEMIRQTEEKAEENLFMHLFCVERQLLSFPSLKEWDHVALLHWSWWCQGGPLVLGDGNKMASDTVN